PSRLSLDDDDDDDFNDDDTTEVPSGSSHSDSSSGNNYAPASPASLTNDDVHIDIPLSPVLPLERNI
ncbi:hypothetical protein IWW57_004206, partial [Coemansia sp. S610]